MTDESPPPPLWTIHATFGVLLAGVLIAIVWGFYSSAALALRGETTTATCTKKWVTTRPDSSGSRITTNHHEFRYHTAEAGSLAAEITPPRAVEVGETIEVVYDPSDPTRVAANTWSGLWSGPGLTLPLCLAMLLWIWRMFTAAGRTPTDSQE